jgi:hypothetical protein
MARNENLDETAPLAEPAQKIVHYYYQPLSTPLSLDPLRELDTAAEKPWSIKLHHYYTPGNYMIEPDQDIIACLVDVPRRHAPLPYAIFYDEGQFWMTEERHRLCLWIKNISYGTSLFIDDNTRLSTVLKQPELAYRLCTIPVGNSMNDEEMMMINNRPADWVDHDEDNDNELAAATAAATFLSDCPDHPLEAMHVDSATLPLSSDDMMPADEEEDEEEEAEEDDDENGARLPVICVRIVKD